MFIIKAFKEALQKEKERKNKENAYKALVSRALDHQLLKEIVNEAKTGTVITLIFVDGSKMEIRQELPSSASQFDPRVNSLF